MIDKIKDVSDMNRRLDQYYRDIAPIVSERFRLNGMIDKIILHPDGRVEYVLPEAVKRLDQQYETLLLSMLKMYLGEESNAEAQRPAPAVTLTPLVRHSLSEKGAKL